MWHPRGDQPWTRQYGCAFRYRCTTFEPDRGLIVRLFSLLLTLLLASAVVALWWAGFAPFPTEPVRLASYQVNGFCTVSGNNWADCSPDSRPSPSGSLGKFRLFPKSKRNDISYGPYGQWGVEGFNGCWDDGCANIFHSPGGSLEWTIYNESDVPEFGLGAAEWVLTVASVKVGQMGQIFPTAAYTTYAACMYRKPADVGYDYYNCTRMESGDPWHVGQIRQ